MKKLYLFIAIIFAISMTANAQYGKRPGSGSDTKFGVKAGANLANMVGDDIKDSDILFGFHVGGYAQFGLSNALHFKENCYLIRREQRIRIQTSH